MLLTLQCIVIYHTDGLSENVKSKLDYLPLERGVLKKTVSGIMLAVLALSTTFSFTPSSQASGSHFGMYGDVLIAPDLPKEPSQYVVSPSSALGYYETSEYLIGSVAVGIIFLESNGTIDPSTEDWTTARESSVTSEIWVSGLSWLANYYPKAGVRFFYDIHYKVPTRYEPINRPHYDSGLWISEAMAYLGYSGTSYFTQVRDYLNALRRSRNADWSFAIFVVDSLRDPDGCFTDWINPTRKWSAFSYLGGPLLVMTYDNDGYGISNMDYVTAHETCHIFYATDEYDGRTQTSGYLGVQDREGSGDMMDKANTWWLCTNSQEQLGWRDSDGDGIQDIVDTFPDTFLNPYEPDPTNEVVLTYRGNATVIPYPNNNPYGTGRDVTIVTIGNAQFRVDYGNWMDTISADGAFDEAEEDFTFTTPTLLEGTHTIEVRGVNSVGNIETSYASDTVTVKPETKIKLDVEPASVTQTVGHAFQMNVTISDVVDLYSYQINLYFDKAILKGTLVELPTDHFLKPQNPANIFIVDLSIVNDFNATHGRIQVAITLLSNELGKTGNGTLFAVTFQAVASGMSSIEIEPVVLVNSQAHALVPGSIQNGTVFVEGKRDTKLMFALSPNPAKVGERVTLLGNLTTFDNQPCPNVVVSISINGSMLPNLCLTNASGWFTAWGSLDSGTYIFEVYYAGSELHNPSSDTDTLIVQTLTKADTQLAFSLAPNPVSPGVTVTLSGTLKDTVNNPVYPAQVKVEYSTNGGATWNSAWTLNTNSAGAFSITFTAPVVGTYLLRVSYAGSVAFNPSSYTQTLTVQTGGKVNTQITFTLSPNPANPGVTVTLSGTVKDVNGKSIYPAQVKVDYSTNGGATWNSAWTLNTNSAGAFYKTFTAPGTGTYLIRVSYTGSASYNPSNHTETLNIQ
jgi:hypothetical protein